MPNFENSNMEHCSLFNSLQMHILFEFFQIQEDHLRIESIQVN
jgi:hypothetical protein